MRGRQVRSGHYAFESYVSNERWNSYYYQIRETLECGDAKRVLVIGVGDGIMPDMIKRMNKEIQVDTFDVDETLNPDICGDIVRLSLKIKQKYDVIVCCQVCEHIMFREFDRILYELRNSIKIRGGKLILSLPVRYFPITFWLDVPKIHFHFAKNITKFWERDFKFDGQHYWEIGPKKYSKSRIRKKIMRYFKIVKEYHVPNNPYHYFYICESGRRK